MPPLSHTTAQEAEAWIKESPTLVAAERHISPASRGCGEGAPRPYV